MKDYYTLKEVIFGLRNEQLRAVRRLQELKKYINLYNQKSYEKDYFYLNILGILWYAQKHKLNLSSRLFEFLDGNLKNALSGYKWSKELIGNIDGCFKKYTDMFEITNYVGFIENLDDILNDDFIKKFSLEYTSISTKNPLLIFFYNNTHSWHLKKKDKGSQIDYYANDDTLEFITDYHNKSYQEIIDELLEVRFPRYLFSEYIQNIIDNNDEEKKEIIIPDKKIYTKNARFYINDERDAFVLVKK